MRFSRTSPERSIHYRYNDDYEAERNEMQAVADKSEKLWILKYMCTKCDAMFDSGMELGGHLTICAG